MHWVYVVLVGNIRIVVDVIYADDVMAADKIFTSAYAKFKWNEHPFILTYALEWGPQCLQSFIEDHPVCSH